MVGFPGGSESKESACSAGDLGSMPGSGRSPGEGNGYPRQYSCLGNSSVHGKQHGLYNSAIISCLSYMLRAENS